MLLLAFVLGWAACRCTLYFTVDRPMREMARQTRKFLAEHPVTIRAEH